MKLIIILCVSAFVLNYVACEGPQIHMTALPDVCRLDSLYDSVSSLETLLL